MHAPQVYKVCPRNRTKLAPDAKTVAITFNLLKPYFNKPLTEASEELGLSCTAIKKACRKFGIPKWPFRTLTSKSSRNRSTFHAITMRLAAMNTALFESGSEAEEVDLSSCEEEEEEQEQQQQQSANRRVEECWSPVSLDDDGFEEFTRAASPPSTQESEETEADQHHSLPMPLEIYCLEEAKETDLKSPKARVSDDDYMSFLSSSDSFDEPVLESYDSELFAWNTGM